MNRTLPLIVVILALAIAVPAAAVVEVDRFDESLEVGDQSLVWIDLPVGALRVDGVDGDRVEVSVVVSCGRWSGRCRQLAERIRLRASTRLNSVELSLEGYPRNAGSGPKVELAVRMPRRLALEIDMGVGDLEVAGVAGDVTIDLGVGDARVAVASSAVGPVALEVGVGSAELRPRPSGVARSSFLFMGNEVSWDGPGRAEISIEVGVGEAEVRLE